MQPNSMIDEFWVDYKALIQQISRNLPTLPVIVSELTNILEDTDNSTQQVEDVMISDQAISTRVLRIANTSFYRGNREKITETNDAIGMLGFDKIKKLPMQDFPPHRARACRIGFPCLDSQHSKGSLTLDHNF